MRKGLYIFAALLLLSGSIMALPSYTGLRGLNRTVDAKTIGAGEFSLGLFSFIGISSDTRVAYLSGTATNVTDKEYNGTWYITAAAGLGDKFEIAGRISYVWNCLSRSDTPGRQNLIGGQNEHDDGFSEAHLFLKYAIDSSGDLRIGIMPWAGFEIYNGGDNPYVTNYNQFDGIWYPEQPMFEMRRPMIATNFSAGADLLLSLDLHPAVLHTNVGYHYFKQNFQFTDHRYGTNDSIAVNMDLEDPVFHLAMGIEYPMKGLTLFTEAEWRHFMKRDYEDQNGESYDDMIIIQPGLRFPLGSGFACDLVGGFSIDNFDPEWSDLGHHAYQAGGNPSDTYRGYYAPFPEGYYPSWGVGVNLMYSSDLVEGPKTAVVAGTVTDALTGEALEATVAFPGTAVDPSVSDAGTGFYSATLPEGSVAVAVSSPGYLTVNETLAVTAGEDLSRDYALQPEPGKVIGSVTDLETGLAIAGATVAVPDAAASDRTGSDGLYELSVGEGNWNVSVSADGYLGATGNLNITSGEEVALDFQLQSVIFEPVYFNSDEYSIKPEFFSLLNAIAENIIANDLMVLLSGHTDSDHTEEYNQTLSENRAKAVFDYLVDHGVNASSLSTIGHGETMPAVPNTSEANKALNRRVEFSTL